jgi:hypothetical protein
VALETSRRTRPYKASNGGYRIDRPSKKGIGWLMEVAWPASGSRQRWVARDGDAASEPLPLEEAKRAAEELLNNRRKTKPRDHIRELNQIAANEVGRVVIEREKRTWPVDLMGGQRHRRKQPLMAIDPKLRQAILDTERILVDDERVTPGALQGDDYPIEMDGDGYPIMPACLRRTEETGLVPTIPSDVEEAA